MKHYLVTGTAGFIGSSLSAVLLDGGAQVTGVDNFDPFYARELKEQNIKSLLSRPGYRLIEADITDLQALHEKASAKFDAIVHLAAKAGVRPSILDPLAYQNANVSGTQTLLELARQNDVKQFIFASSSSVYGLNPRVPWSENDHVLQPISPYASTKVSGELLGHVYSHLYGIRFIALRFFTVYGPRQRPDLAIRKYAELMLAGEPIPVFGDGSTSRDYTYVDDVTAAVRAAINYDRSGFEVINIGNDRAITLSEMIRALENALGVTAQTHCLPAQPGDVPRTCADIRKAKQLLGFSPSVPFELGVKNFVDWVRDKKQETRLL